MHQEILDFGNHAGKLKKTKRKGWISWVGVKNPESVADHTFRSAVLMMCLSDLKGLDTNKLVHMMLLHDIHEAIIGDFDYFDKKKLGKAELEEKEEEAIRTVFGVLPPAISEKYSLLAKEYQMQQSSEAKLVRQVDRVEMIMQALEYEREGYDKTKLQAFWTNIGQEMQDPDLSKIFRLLEAKRSSESI